MKTSYAPGWRSPPRLSPRETHTLFLILKELSRDEIQRELNVSARAARNYVRAVFRKLRASTMKELLVRVEQGRYVLSRPIVRTAKLQLAPTTMSRAQIADSIVHVLAGSAPHSLGDLSEILSVPIRQLRSPLRWLRGAAKVQLDAEPGRPRYLLTESALDEFRRSRSAGLPDAEESAADRSDGEATAAAE